MAPDRGDSSSQYQAISQPPALDHDRGQTENSSEDVDNAVTKPSQQDRQHDEARQFLAAHAAEGQNFTVRGVLVGLAIGVIICFSNTYFGLQTGWISGMAMPSALIGFAYFKLVAKYIAFPFTPVENVLVQTVAGAVGTMPLGCGFVGVIPALNYMLKPEENGPLIIGTGKLMIWALGICFFGVVIAVPLRKEVIIREKLKFPSGTATALMIGVLHGDEGAATLIKREEELETPALQSHDEDEPSNSPRRRGLDSVDRETSISAVENSGSAERSESDHRSDWKARIRLLVTAFAISALYTLTSYFIPQIHDIPIFGLPLAHKWLWTLNPSPAYIGQGIIMGPATTLHMLLGAVLGWAILSPLAKSRGWAPGPVEDWSTGSKGWIVWVSLAIMLADSIISLGWLLLRPVISHGSQYLIELRRRARATHWSSLFHSDPSSKSYHYTALAPSEPSTPLTPHISHHSQLQSPSSKAASPSPPEPDAPPSHLVPTRIVLLFSLLSILICIGAVQLVFGALIPLHATLLSILLGALLSIVGVRALGETDLNPVSGISKLTQLLFAFLVTPTTNPNAITINLLAGAISESAALQAGDMMQDLKTGHLLGAAPKAQFYGQIIGSAVGAVVSAAVYKLYTSVYEVPGGMFQVPTGYVWIFTARLVTGQGLPEMAWQWALGAGLVFAALTGARAAGQGRRWQAWIPGGIAVAVGMYNTPSFTLARTIGGLVNWYWQTYRRREETAVIVLASGLILGEGVVSIVNLLLASLDVPHL